MNLFEKLAADIMARVTEKLAINYGRSPEPRFTEERGPGTPEPEFLDPRYKTEKWLDKQKAENPTNIADVSGI